MITKIDLQGRILLSKNLVKYMNLKPSYIANFDITENNTIHVRFSSFEVNCSLHSKLDEKCRFVLPTYFSRNYNFERNSKVEITILNKSELEISNITQSSSCIFCGVKLADGFYSFKSQKICIKCLKSFANSINILRLSRRYFTHNAHRAMLQAEPQGS